MKKLIAQGWRRTE